MVIISIMDKNYTNDLDKVISGFKDWLNQMSEGLAPGRFRFAGEESFVPCEGGEGLVTTCFAMRAAWQSGLWDAWSDEQRKGCLDFVKSFQKSSGFFEDPWLSRSVNIPWRAYVNALIGRIPYEKVFLRKELNLRAETRQAAATLYMAGEKSPYPLPVQIKTPKQAVKYFNSFNWNHPWSAGSHLSHQLMLLSLNAKWFGLQQNYREIIEAFSRQLDSLQNKDNQCWYKGNPPDNIKINGAMKVFIGRQWLDIPKENYDKLLEFALKQPFCQDGCNFFNRLFVVYQCVRQGTSGHQLFQAEIKELARLSLNEILRYSRDDGGFSFYLDKSQSGYYGAVTGSGKLQGDMHGAAMFSWALAVCSQLLGEDAPVCIKNWTVYKG